MKRQRGRGRKPGGGGGGGNHGNHGNRPFESNGPDVKIRGTAAQIYEKYAQYARDAQSGGDRVKYESYLQHAEHYYRVMAASMPRERLLAQQESGFGQAEGEGQNQGGQGGYGQNPQGGPPMGGQGQGEGEGGNNADPLRVMDDQGGDDDDGDDGDDRGGDDGDNNDREGGEEVRAQQSVDQGGNSGEARGRGRRRGRRGRPHDGAGPSGGGGGDDRPNNNGGGSSGNGGGGGSALDSLARKQGALAGG